MQVAIYARVSPPRQSQAQTIEHQLERLAAHVPAQGWGLSADHIFRDDGYSGATLRRPGLDGLRDLVAGGTLERILMTTPDRRPATTFIRCCSSKSCSALAVWSSFWTGR